MKKSLAALALAGSITIAGVTPAMAATPLYPGTPDECAVVLSGTVTVGVPFDFFSSASTGCFVPGAELSLTVVLDTAPQAIGGGLTMGLGTAVPGKINTPASKQTIKAKADTSGNFSTQVTIDAPGNYTVTATGAGGSYSTSVTAVTPTVSSASNSGASGDALASTGIDSGLLLWTLVGAGALAAGATSVVLVRRRAKSSAVV